MLGKQLFCCPVICMQQRATEKSLTAKRFPFLQSVVVWCIHEVTNDVLQYSKHGCFSLPAAAVDSCWRGGPVASSIALDTLLGLWAWWETAGPAYRELQPWEPSSLAHLAPLLPARSASCPRAPSPSPAPNSSPPALSPQGALLPCSTPPAASPLGCLSSRRPVAMAPSIPPPTGQPRLSPPWAAQVSGRQAGTRGGLHITWPPPADSLRQDVKLMSPQPCN